MLIIKESKNGGFTLIEVMVAVTILSVGMILIYQALFNLLNSATFLSNRQTASLEANNKLWEIESALASGKEMNKIPISGKLYCDGVFFNWNFSSYALNETSGLYKIDMHLSWKEGINKRSFLRTAYILK